MVAQGVPQGRGKNGLKGSERQKSDGRSGINKLLETH